MKLRTSVFLLTLLVLLFPIVGRASSITIHSPTSGSPAVVDSGGSFNFRVTWDVTDHPGYDPANGVVLGVLFPDPADPEHHFLNSHYMMYASGGYEGSRTYEGTITAPEPENTYDLLVRIYSCKAGCTTNGFLCKDELLITSTESDAVVVGQGDEAPVITLNCGPASCEADGGKIPYSWSVTDDHTPFSGIERRWRLEGPNGHGWTSWDTITIGITYKELLDGSHTLYLQARDDAGNVSEESCTVTVDCDHIDLTKWVDDFTTFRSNWYYQEGSGYWDAGRYILTPEADYRIGKLFYKAPFYTGNFKAEFDFRITGTGTGADGFTAAFVRYYTYSTPSGATLGFWNADGVALEFDTYQDLAGDFPSGVGEDPPVPHMAVVEDRSNNHLVHLSIGNIRNNGWHHVIINWVAPHMQVSIDGQVVMTTSLEEISPFTGYFGFTAATGYFTDRHEIDSVSVIPGAGEIPDHTVSTPNTPSGPSSGKVGESLTFSTGGASCSQGHSVQYRFDWGDSSGYSMWSSSPSDSHSYSRAGTYQVKAQARCADDYAVLSGWSTATTVVIVPNQIYQPEVSVPVYAPIKIGGPRTGCTAMFAIEVTNAGNTEDLISIGASLVGSLPSGAQVSLSVPIPYAGLQPGESEIRYVKAEMVNPNSDERVWVTLRVTATSTLDPSKNSQCDVILWSRSIPLVFHLEFKNPDSITHHLEFSGPIAVVFDGPASLDVEPSTQREVKLAYSFRSGDDSTFSLTSTDTTSGKSVSLILGLLCNLQGAINFDVSSDGYGFPNYEMAKIGDLELGAHCFGMSETSILYYNYRNSITPQENPPKSGSTYSWCGPTVSRCDNEVVQRISAHQFPQHLVSNARLLTGGFVDLTSEYELVRDEIVNQKKLIIVAFACKPPGAMAKGFHAVVAYKVFENDLYGCIVVYDNNYPYQGQKHDGESVDFDEQYPVLVYDKQSATLSYSIDDYGPIPRMVAIKPEANRNIVSVVFGSPVSITITDASGQTISDSGTNNIPGADMVVLQVGTESKVQFYLPSDGPYEVFICSLETGTLDILKIGTCGNLFSMDEISGVLITQDARLHITIHGDVCTYTVGLDRNGDGTVDEILSSQNVFSTNTNLVTGGEYPEPRFSYSPSLPTVGTPVQFDASPSTDHDGYISSYQWILGAGASASGRVVNHTYTSPGIFMVHLVVIDNSGLASATCRDVRVCSGVRGDLDGDGEVGVLDVRICLQIATGFLEGTAAQRAAADVDGDGDVDLADAEWLAKYIIHIIDELGGD